MPTQMHTDVYRGIDNWWGFTPVDAGSSELPEETGPWRPHHTRWWVSKDHPVQRVANDREIIAGVEEKGFYVCRADPDHMDRMLKGERQARD